LGHPAIVAAATTFETSWAESAFSTTTLRNLAGEDTPTKVENRGILAREDASVDS
jgi:hypothetical protein